MNKLLLAVLMLASASTMAGVVKWTDEEGVVHYSDKPPEGRQGQVVAYHDTTEWKESGFASIYDVNAVPGLNDKTRAAYMRFLDLPTPRTFLLCHDGSVSTINGFVNIVLRKTREKIAEGCALYAVDTRVVYTGSPAGGTTSNRQ